MRELFLLFLNTKQNILKRPDAICYNQGNPKGRSVYQSKLVKIIRQAYIMQPANEHENTLKQIILKG